MSDCPETDFHIRYKVKVVLDMLNYPTKKQNDTTDVDTSNLAAKRNLVALKVVIDKLDLDKLVNDPTDLNNLNTEVDNLYAGTFITVALDLKKLSDVVSKNVLKNTKFNI